MNLKESYECSGKMNILNNGMEMRKGGPTQSNEQSDLVGTPHLTSKKKGSTRKVDLGFDRLHEDHSLNLVESVMS